MNMFYSNKNSLKKVGIFLLIFLGGTILGISQTSFFVDCVTGTVDLSTVSTSNPPVGTILTWHSSSPVSTANRISDVSALSPDTYYASFYDAANDCYSDYTIVQVIDCVQNTCPLLSVNLNTAFSVSNLPTGAVLQWHTEANPVDQSTIVNDVTVVGPGIYYAVFYDAANDCYKDQSTGISVDIEDCGCEDVVLPRIRLNTGD